MSRAHYGETTAYGLVPHVRELEREMLHWRRRAEIERKRQERLAARLDRLIATNDRLKREIKLMQRRLRLIERIARVAHLGLPGRWMFRNNG